MNIKRVVASIAGFAILSFAVVQVHGFVNDASDFPYIEDSSALAEMIDDIASNIEADDAIEKIDGAISELDEILDNEPQNEGEILELRDALVDLRVKAIDESDSPELNEPQLVDIVDVVQDAPAILPPAGGEVATAPVFSGGGGGAVVSGGGGSVASGINWRRLALLGGLAGGLATIGGDDDNAPAVVSMGAPAPAPPMMMPAP